MIGPKDVDAITDLALTSAQTLKNINGIVKRSSVLKMADDAIYQYPTIFDGGIDDDEIMIMSKSLEKDYATAVVVAYSLNPTVDLGKYSNISEYIRSFHNNSGVPTNFKAAHSSMESTMEIELDDFEVVGVEGAQAVCLENTQILQQVAMKCWNVVQEQLDAESVNDIYKPYERTKYLLKSRVDMANEALSDKIQGAQRAVSDFNQNFDARGDKAGGLNTGGTVTQAQTDKVTGMPVLDCKGKPIMKTTKYNATSERKFINGIARNDKQTALEPTMVNVQLTCHGKEQGQFTINVTLGIKVMARKIMSSLMVSNLVEATKNSNKIFDFIKWTKGELSTADRIFKISEQRDMAKVGDPMKEILKENAIKRKKLNGIGKFFHNKVFPTLTIIADSNTIVAVAEQTGVDLSKRENALSLINKYYLLAFGIYDSNSKTLTIMKDNDTDWNYASISFMTSDNNRVVNLMDSARLKETYGRRG